MEHFSHWTGFCNLSFRREKENAQSSRLWIGCKNHGRWKRNNTNAEPPQTQNIILGMQGNWLLLDLIHADRDAKWLLRFDTFKVMLPYERAFDLLNYLRCGNVYITDMKMLPEVSPTVYTEFTKNRNHAVTTSCSESSFNSVSPYLTWH